MVNDVAQLICRRRILRRKFSNCKGCGVSDGSTGGVVDGDAQLQGLALRRCQFGAPDLSQKRRGDAVTPADDFETRSLLAQPLALKAKECADDPEDALHLLRRACPVVRGECVKGESTDAEDRRGFNGATNRCDARAMTRDPR